MNNFTEEEVRKNCLKIFKGEELAATVWMKKYILRDKDKFLESGPNQRYQTIAQEIVRIENKYSNAYLTADIVYKSLGNSILPGGSAISGIGKHNAFVSLGNCFVISGNGEDSYGSVCKNDQEIVQIAKRRGGVGFDLAHYRPKGSFVKNAAISSTGSVSFANRFSNSTREVGQDGRRGALMLSHHINHPDILEFIKAKDNSDAITGANISVKVTDEFMRAVENDGIHQLRFPINAPFIKNNIPLGQQCTYPDGVIRINVRARELFGVITDIAWRRAEPGILFWDKIINESPTDGYPGYKTSSTNPCGEIPLSPYDSCRLLSIALPHYVTNAFTKTAQFDKKQFISDVRIATRMMDNIIDLEIEKIEGIISKIESDPESELTKAIELNLWKNILRTTVGGRRAGISLIGHGDFLAMLGMNYADEESIAFVRDIHNLHAIETYRESVELAKQRGAFPDFRKEYDSGDFLKRIGFTGIPRRNIALLTIPPSGTISILFNNQSSGIEPVFAAWYERSRKVTDGERFDYIDDVGDKWKTYTVFHPYFREWAKVNGISEEELDSNKEYYLEKSPYYNNTSHFVDPLQKVKMQGEIQKYVDHSISMTTNLPKNATKKDIENIYLAAWKNGCKGATVYRDGSRTGVLNVSSITTKESFSHHSAPKRPRELPCDLFHATINGERYLVMVGLIDGYPYEVFALKKRGNFDVSNAITSGIIRKQKSKHWQLLEQNKNVLVENIIEEFEIPEYGTVTKLASLALRHGAAIEYVVKVLNNNDGIITNYSKVIARQLKRYIKPDDDNNESCPVCGQLMVVEGGCKQCKNPECGYGQCG